MQDIQDRERPTKIMRTTHGSSYQGMTYLDKPHPRHSYEPRASKENKIDLTRRGGNVQTVSHKIFQAPHSYDYTCVWCKKTFSGAQGLGKHKLSCKDRKDEGTNPASSEHSALEEGQEDASEPERYCEILSLSLP